MRIESSRRALLALVLVAVLASFAGCSGIGGGSSGDATNATSTQTSSTSTTNATSSSTTSETSEHTHTHTSSEETSATNGSAGSAASGTLTLLVGGSQVDLSGSADSITFADGARTWSASEDSLTLAAALGTQDVNATAETLSYDGTTYDAADDGTTVAYRVNGHAVDPTEATLDDGDSVWVYVSTPSTDVQPPGAYLPEATDHQHGSIEVVVDGEPLNLSRERFQEQNRYFHLEGGDGDTWHAHTYNATYGWALGTLGVDVTADSVTYDNTTYTDGDGATVKVLVNGHAVDPESYRLKDGDAIRVVASEN